MAIKAIFFLVVVGAVAVLAKKGSSSSEEDRNGNGIMNVWPYPRPAGSSKPFKFKGPKHQVFIVGRPEYQQQGYYPQGPQFPGPQRPQRPHFPPRPEGPGFPQGPEGPGFPQRPEGPGFPQGPEGPGFPQGQPEISPVELQQYFGNIQREMQEFSARAYKEFQSVENEINRNKKQMEETLKSQFQTLELSLEAKQDKQIQQALKEGKDELKIQECLAEEEGDVRADMDADIQRTTDCMNDATERALKVVADARNTYTESSFFSSMQARDWAQKVKFCAEQRNHRCVEDGMNLINEKTKNTVQEGMQFFEKVQDAPRKQMIQLDYCRENFKEDLKDMREAYSQMVKRCIIASEIQNPEEESEEKTGKVEVDVEAKPEEGAGVEAEAEV